MKFLVCIKQVPDVSSNVQTGRMVLNAYDASAVEEALVLSGSDSAEIHLVSIGPDSAKETIRKALAMGATSATHLLLDDGVELDSAGVSILLDEYCRDQEFDVILCGKQSQDTDSGLTGSMLAARLDLPYATNAVGLSVSNGSMRVTRQGDSGQEILELPTPCLITCSNDMNNPRIPSLKGIMQAKRKEIETVGVDAPAMSTRMLGFEDPAERQPAIMFEGDADESVEALVSALEKATDLIHS